MAKATAEIYCQAEMSSLSTAMRHSVAEQRYAEAVRMYSESKAPLNDIAKKCGVTPGGLGNYIARYHRDLLMKRYGIETLNCTVPLKPRVGQSIHTYKKYRTAIRACSDMAFIEFNISQIARIFGHDGTALASQLRFHYPEVIPERERVRRELGIADNIHRGVRPWCEETYAEAVALYRDTDMTVREAAEACNVSVSGLGQHLQFYNKPVVGQKAAKRDTCSSRTDAGRTGTLSGNGRKYGPQPDTVEKYAEALNLYRKSGMTIKEVASASGVPYSGFRNYIRQWHSGSRTSGHRADAAADKYAPAIGSMEESPRHIAQVAAEFGLNPDVFRQYLQKHRPDLAEGQGMELRSDGKRVKRASAEKYAKAVEEFAASAESLKDIAKRHGLVYNSLSAYVRRNCPAEIESHRKKLLSTN